MLASMITAFLMIAGFCLAEVSQPDSQPVKGAIALLRILSPNTAINPAHRYFRGHGHERGCLVERQIRYAHKMVPYDPSKPRIRDENLVHTDLSLKYAQTYVENEEFYDWIDPKEFRRCYLGFMFTWHREMFWFNVPQDIPHDIVPKLRRMSWRIPPFRDESQYLNFSRFYDDPMRHKLHLTGMHSLQSHDLFRSLYTADVAEANKWQKCYDKEDLEQLQLLLRRALDECPGDRAKDWGITRGQNRTFNHEEWLQQVRLSAANKDRPRIDGNWQIGPDVLPGQWQTKSVVELPEPKIPTNPYIWATEPIVVDTAANVLPTVSELTKIIHEAYLDLHYNLTGKTFNVSNDTLMCDFADEIIKWDTSSGSLHSRALRAVESFRGSNSTDQIQEARKWVHLFRDEVILDYEKVWHPKLFALLNADEVINLEADTRRRNQWMQEIGRYRIWRQPNGELMEQKDLLLLRDWVERLKNGTESAAYYLSDEFLKENQKYAMNRSARVEKKRRVWTDMIPYNRPDNVNWGGRPGSRGTITAAERRQRGMKAIVMRLDENEKDDVYPRINILDPLGLRRNHDSVSQPRLDTDWLLVQMLARSKIAVPPRSRS